MKLKKSEWIFPIILILALLFLIPIFLKKDFLATQNPRLSGTGVNLLWLDNDTSIYPHIELGNNKQQAMVSETFDIVGIIPEDQRLYDASNGNIIWQTGPPGNNGSYIMKRLDGAKNADVYAIIIQETPSNFAFMPPKVMKFSSPQATVPDWTYTFPFYGYQEGFGQNVAVSEDGNTIAAIASNLTSNELMVFFHPDSPIPYKTFNLSFFGTPELLDISSDGSTLAIAGGLRVEVYNISSSPPTFLLGKYATVLSSGGDSSCLSLSENGDVFAFWALQSTTEDLNIFVRGPSGSYIHKVIEYTPDPMLSCAALEISHDGNTLPVAAYKTENQYPPSSYPGLKTEVTRQAKVENILTLKTTDNWNSFFFSMNYTTKQPILNNRAPNQPTGLKIDQAGNRFAVSYAGSDSFPEVKLFETSNDNPIVSINSEGSPQDIEISLDGTRFAMTNTIGYQGDLVHASQVSVYEIL